MVELIDSLKDETFKVKGIGKIISENIKNNLILKQSKAILSFD